MVAVSLAVFLGSWAWLYTYASDKKKFWFGILTEVGSLCALPFCFILGLLLIGDGLDVEPQNPVSVVISKLLPLALLLLFLVFVAVRAAVITDRAARPSSWYRRPAVQPRLKETKASVTSVRPLPKKRTTAITLALIPPGLLFWFYIYDRKHWAFWLSSSITAVFLCLVLFMLMLPVILRGTSYPAEGANIGAGLLILFFLLLIFGVSVVLLGLWFWTITEAVSKSKSWYGGYPN